MNRKAFFVTLLIIWIFECDGIPILNEAYFIDIRHYSSNGFNLTIKNTDFQLNAAVRQRLIEIYFEIYPRLVKRFNPNAPHSINVFIDDQNNHPFWGLAVDSKMIINANRLREPSSYPRYYDIFLHELAHLVQQYTTRNLIDVKWLGEGLADYVRYRYGGFNANANWPLPDYSYKDIFNDSYKVTARFLIWLEYEYQSSVIDQLDQSLRDATYDQNTTWHELTGKSIEQLWKEYGETPALISNILFLTTATVEIGNIATIGSQN